MDALLWENLWEVQCGRGVLYIVPIMKLALFHGGIVGQIVRSNVNTADDNNSTTVTYYVSQLTVPINSGTIGKSIECLCDDGAISTLVGREKNKHYNRY